MKYLVFWAFVITLSWAETLTSFLQKSAPKSYKKSWEVMNLAGVKDLLAQQQSPDSAWVVVLPQDKNFKGKVYKKAMASEQSAYEFVEKAVVQVKRPPKTYDEFIQMTTADETLTLSGSRISFKKKQPYISQPTESGDFGKGIRIKVNKNPIAILDDATVFEIQELPDKLF